MKHVAIYIFGLILSVFSATLPAPTNAAVWDALSAPAPTLICESSPTWTPQPQTITGKVVGVADGDTITVLDANNQQIKVRLDRRPDRGAKGAVAVNVPVAGGQIIGNRSSKIYHLPGCPDYGKVSERNRVPFASEAEAVKAGYRKARNCPQ